MTQKYTNNENISLPMALWLVTDTYDGHDTRPNVISVTTLLKPVRQYILTKRLKAGEGLVDISLLLAAQLGNAVHAAIENAWKTNAKQGMIDLGYPKGIVNTISINPSEPNEDETQIYLEYRSEKEINGWILSGCTDMICDFHGHDVKSTSVNMYLRGSKKEDHINQLSMYRWLNPDKITEDTGYIEYIFKDWGLIKSFHTPNYPSSPILQEPIQLKPVHETERFITDKLNVITALIDAPQEELPLCTDEELWRDPPTYQYFSKVTNARATKNFKTQIEANSMMLTKGTGVIKVKTSKAIACLFCPAASICTQYADMKSKNLIASKD